MAFQNNRVPNQWIYCNCISSEQSKIVKNGRQNGVQRYKCNSCNKNFQKDYRYHAYWPNTNQFLVQLLCEGISVLGISRVLNISKNTVLARMLKIASKIQPPIWKEQDCKFQMDELWTFMGKKEKGTYLIYCLETRTGQVVDFSIGQRSYQKIRPIMEKVLSAAPSAVCTDRLPLYKNLIPKTKHKVFKYATNKIERNNLTLRTHIKRLSRKTICFSKSLEHLEAHLKIYFWGSSQVKFNLPFNEKHTTLLR